MRLFLPFSCLGHVNGALPPVLLTLDSCSDAADLVRTIMKAVQYIHGCGIVHRDLKPENLIFRTKKEDADVMIADFGLSRVMEEEKFQMLTEICGTPGVSPPYLLPLGALWEAGKCVDVQLFWVVYGA